MSEPKSPKVYPNKQPSRLTVSAMAERYGVAIADVIEPGTAFVLLVFRPGPVEQGGGIAWQANVEASIASEAVEAFRSQIAQATSRPKRR